MKLQSVTLSTECTCSKQVIYTTPLCTAIISLLITKREIDATPSRIIRSIRPWGAINRSYLLCQLEADHNLHLQNKFCWCNNTVVINPIGSTGHCSFEMTPSAQIAWRQ